MKSEPIFQTLVSYKGDTGFSSSSNQKEVLDSSKKGESPSPSPDLQKNQSQEETLEGVFVYVDPQTCIVVQEIRDRSTGEVLEQTPSKEVVGRYEQYQQDYKRIQRREEIQKEINQISSTEGLSSLDKKVDLASEERLHKILSPKEKI